MSSNKGFCSFALGSAHEKFDVWTRPNSASLRSENRLRWCYLYLINRPFPRSVWFRWFGKYRAKLACICQSLAFNFDKTCSREIETNDSMIRILLFPSAMSISNQSIGNQNYIENEALVCISTVDVRFQSAVSWERFHLASPLDNGWFIEMVMHVERENLSCRQFHTTGSYYFPLNWLCFLCIGHATSLDTPCNQGIHHGFRVLIWLKTWVITRLSKTTEGRQ